MPRTRVLYNAEALFVGPSPSTGDQTVGNGIVQLHRVQTIGWDLNIPRTPVNQYAQLDEIDEVIVQSPTVNLNFSYLATNALNEQSLGLVTNGASSIIANFLNKTQDDRNYYILTVPEGRSAAFYTGAATTNTVVGIGNTYLSSYSIEAAVGGLPTITCRAEGLNVNVYGSSSGQPLPSINPTDGSSVTGYTFTLPQATSGVSGQVSTLRPGDIQLSLVNPPLGVNVADAKVQRFTLAFDLAREPQEKIGSTFATSREIRFPVAVTLSVEAVVGDLTTGNLNSVLCDDQKYSVGIVFNKPACPGQTKTPAMAFNLYGAKLESQNFNGSIGPSKTVTMNYRATMASAEALDRGLFLSGVLV